MKNMTAIQMGYSLALVVSVKDTDTGDSFDMVKELFYLTFLVALFSALHHHLESICYRAGQLVSDVIRPVVTALIVWTKITIWAVT